MTQRVTPPDKPLWYYEQWDRELRDGVGGQDRCAPSTWRFDELWRAACLQLQAKEAEEFLRTAIVNQADPGTVRALLADIRSTRNAAHCAYAARRAQPAEAEMHGRT